MTLFGFTFGLSFLWALPLLLAPILAFLALQARRQRMDVSSLLLFRDLPRRETYAQLCDSLAFLLIPPRGRAGQEGGRGKV